MKDATRKMHVFKFAAFKYSMGKQTFFETTVYKSNALENAKEKPDAVISSPYENLVSELRGIEYG